MPQPEKLPENGMCQAYGYVLRMGRTQRLAREIEEHIIALEEQIQTLAGWRDDGEEIS